MFYYTRMNTYDMQDSPSLKQSQFKNSKLTELRNTLQKTKQKTQPQSPPQLPSITPQSPIQSPNLSPSLPIPSLPSPLLSTTNRHLRYLYHQFCKQSYIGGSHGTFDDIAESAEVMTRNKWMVFCREFGILGRVSAREAVLVFRLATSQRLVMNIQEFCKALDMVKERTKINPEQFATEILHVDNHLSARNRLGVMKINFSGPKSNFFIQSTIPQKQRQQQKTQLKTYKHKQRQLILHQGMFSQHIEQSLLQRKSARLEKQLQIRNKSMNTNTTTAPSSQRSTNNISLTSRKTRQPYIQISPSIYTKSKSILGNYSKIFQSKRTTNTGTLVNGSFLGKIGERLGVEKREGDGQEGTQSKSRIMYEQRKLNGSREGGGEREDQMERKDELEEMDQKWQINSSAESDEILKSHYENQKRLRSNSKQKLIEHPFTPVKQRQENQDNEQTQTDMMITRYT